MPTNQPDSEQVTSQSVQRCGWQRTAGLHIAVVLLWMAAYGAGFLNTLPGLGSLGVSLWYLPAGVTVGAVMALGGWAGVAVAFSASIKSLALGEAPVEYFHGLRHALIFTLAGLAIRQFGGAWPLSRVRNSAWFVGIGLLAAASSACAGVTLNAVASREAPGAALLALPSWIVGDAIGVLTVAPLMLILFGRCRSEDRPLALSPIAGSLGLVTAANLIAFGLPAWRPDIPVLWFLVILAPIAVAVTFGSAACVIAIAVTNLVFPPLAGAFSANLDHFEQQLFLLMISLTGLLLSGALGERDSALLALQDRERGLAHEVEARTAEIKRNSEAHIRILASLSHDLRQPVQALTLYLELLHRTALPAVATEPLSRAVLLASRLRDLVQTVLGLTRDGKSGVRIDRQSFALQRAFDRASAALMPLARRHGIDLSFVSSSAIIDSAPVMLDRILGNLIENAIHHSSGTRVLVGCRRQADKVLVHIIDDGRGMPPGSEPPGSGRGLGWPIVIDTARALDHMVARVASAHGTHIVVTLPRVPRAATGGADKHNPPLSLSGQVLVVEDDPLVLNALAATLRAAGLFVLTALSHREALAVIATAEPRPDLLILDYHLPESRRGTETYQQVEQIVGDVIPAIFITGSTEAADLAELHRHGWPVLTKPVTPAHLLGVIQTVLGGQAMVTKAPAS